MRIRKRVLASLQQVYSVSVHQVAGRSCLTAATEGQGPVLLFSPPDWRVSTLREGPGGVMCLESLPGRQGALAGIEGFFPIFQAEGAGIFVAQAGAQPEQPWQAQRVQDLPFVHRLCAVPCGSASLLVAATVCGGKRDRDDWSQPGALYSALVPEDLSAPGRFELLRGELYQNHGLSLERVPAPRGGASAVPAPLSLLVGCRNGLLRLRVPPQPQPGQRWQEEWLLDRPVSDAALFDLDGDGEQELATIEPFHGHALVLYKRQGGVWRPRFQAELQFGHVVWCGTLLGRPGILAGSRAGKQRLVWYGALSPELTSFEEVEIDRGVEPAQVAVLQEGGRELLLSANHGPGEVALYELSG
jgi:hypothetical protein